MPILLLEWLKTNWLSAALGLVIAGLSITLVWKNHTIKSLELDVGQAKLKIEMAQVAYRNQVALVSKLNSDNAAQVAVLKTSYDQQLSAQRIDHATAYKTVIAHVPAGANGVRFAAANTAGSGPVPQDVTPATGTDASAESTPATDVTEGDCIDAAVQIDGLQEYITTELKLINGKE